MKRSSTALACTAALSVCVLATSAGPAAGAAAPPDARARALGHGQALLGDRAAVAGSADDGYAVRDVVVDPDGTEHVRYARSYRGLPVLGGDLVVHADAAGRLRGVSRTQRAPLALSTAAATTAAQARAAALAAFPGTGAVAGEPALVVTTRTPQARLAWAVTVTGTSPTGDPSELRQVLDAADVRVLESIEGIHTAKPAPPSVGTNAAATGRTLYVGSVPLTTTLSSGTYSLKDATRGGATTSDLQGRTSGAGTLVTSSTATFGDGTTRSRASAAADAAYGVAQTWDYFRTTHGRNGIAGDGRGAPSRVHYGQAYNNAFWSDSCFCMTFGDGDGVQFNPLVSLDVAGHEMTHGVTSRTANLTYAGESGGLNEGTSDIFGTMVEFRAGGTADVPDYDIGEEIVPTGDAPLRYMAQPSRDGASVDCWYAGVGNLDVHYSSGVANHAFFLMAQGSSSAYGASPTCGAPAVTGIGNDAAAKVWYRALTAVHDVEHRLPRRPGRHPPRRRRPVRGEQPAVRRGRRRLGRRRGRLNGLPPAAVAPRRPGAPTGLAPSRFSPPAGREATLPAAGAPSPLREVVQQRRRLLLTAVPGGAPGQPPPGRVGVQRGQAEPALPRALRDAAGSAPWPAARPPWWS